MQNLKPDMQDFNDRTLLKNLGHFLGLLTLGKNRPILYDVSIRFEFQYVRLFCEKLLSLTSLCKVALTGFNCMLGQNLMERKLLCTQLFQSLGLCDIVAFVGMTLHFFIFY